MTTKYDNADWSRCARTYGVLMSTIGDDGDPWNTSQGNNGISLPCRGCWVQLREGGAEDAIVKMSIGTPATAELGVALGRVECDFAVIEGALPLWVPVSDVSQLYFYGTEGRSIDITYLLG